MGGNRIYDDGKLRQCGKCLELKDRETEFGKKSVNVSGLSTWCLDCTRLYKKKRFLKNCNGFTLDQYNELLEKQNHCCAICKKKRPLHIDHSHITGEVRGLLCGSCNRALGLLQESAEILSEAVKYLNQENK